MLDLKLVAVLSSQNLRRNVAAEIFMVFIGVEGQVLLAKWFRARRSLALACGTDCHVW